MASNTIQTGGKWLLLEIIIFGFCFICHEADAHILVYRRLTNQLIEEYNDLPALFGPSLPPNGLKVYAIPAMPNDYACDKLAPPPRSGYPSNAKFVAIISRGGECSFERKVRLAQDATFMAVIVFNNEGEELEQMSAQNSTGINIPAVFVGLTTGTNLRSFFTPEVVLLINDELPFNINTQLILPFSILIGLCFLIMIFYMIYKCIRERRRLRRYRLPKSMLKKLPILKYTKNNTDLAYETCVICLEDFVEDDKLRVLPCRHPYHSHCIDPWLTQNRRVCPICKRKVFTKGEARSNRNRHLSLDSITDTDDDTTPLLQQQQSTNDRIAAGLAATATTRHGTFRRGNQNATATVEVASDDENALLANQSPAHNSRRINPFDRTPNLATTPSNIDRPSIWSYLGFLKRRPPANISVAAPPFLESVETIAADSASTSRSSNDLMTSAANIIESRPVAVVVPHTSNNVLNPNLSGSFKDDDDDDDEMLPHQSIYEPITDSAFLQTPTHGGIGVVALPNTNDNETTATTNNSKRNQRQRQFHV